MNVACGIRPYASRKLILGPSICKCSLTVCKTSHYITALEGGRPMLQVAASGTVLGRCAPAEPALRLRASCPRRNSILAHWLSTSLQRGLSPCQASSAVEPVKPNEAFSWLMEFTHLCFAMGLLFALDKSLKLLFLAQGVSFPAPLAGMFGILGVLLMMGETFSAYALAFFKPALVWIARWLPLFYVAPLVTLPLALAGMSGSEIGKIIAILTVGMAGTCLFTGYSAVWIRNAVKTEMIPIPPEPAAAPYGAVDFALWGVVASLSFVGTAVNPVEWGTVLMLPFQLAVTVGGLLAGSLIPKAYHGVLHPVLVCSIMANGLSYVQASLMGMDYSQSMKAYLMKGAGPPGGGDVLMGFLGLVIISFGFRIYMQRETMKRHAPEILGATLLSSLFSLFSTAFMAKALCLSSDIARALIPRSVTVALAIPIAIGLDAPVSITAAAVLLQGILGANFAPDLMVKARIDDTIARGLSAAATAGGLGTASLVSRQPEALPFCALSYSMVGILSTVIMTVPQVRMLLITIIG